MKEVEWLLDCTPREVQLEALRRSYYGYALYDDKELVPNYRDLRDGPAIGWGHVLEMRLGKTPTFLNEMALFNRDYGVNKFTVFSPNTYKHDWVGEASHFGMELPFLAFESTKPDLYHEFVQKNPDGYVIVVNYEAMQHEKGRKFLEELMQGPRTMIGCDESILLKNPNSIQTKSIMSMGKEVDLTRILTGKPMTQGPHDLYTQLRFIRQLNGKNFYSFRNRYCKMGGFKNKAVKGVKNEDELTGILDRCMFRAKKRSWGTTTRPDFLIEKLQMHPEQVKHYNALEETFLTELDNGDIVSTDQVITKIIKQQQVSSGFIYDEHGKTIQLVKPKEIPKLQRLLQIMEELEGKIVVCYHHNAAADMLTEALDEYNPAFIRSKDWMKKNSCDLIEEKRKFNTSPDCKAIICNIGATKYGHDLSGTEDAGLCRHMAFYENTYSLDARTQVEMRIETSKTVEAATYIDFETNQVEHAPIKALINKESIAGAVLGSYGRERL